MTIICCICPGGCGQPASQSVGAIDQQIVLADSWLLAVPASVGVVRFGSTWTRRSTLDARLPMRLAAAVFDTIYTKCRTFWRFAFVADSIVPRGPWPAPVARCVSGRALWHAPIAATRQQQAVALCCNKTEA